MKLGFSRQFKFNREKCIKLGFFETGFLNLLYFSKCLVSYLSPKMLLFLYIR